MELWDDHQETIGVLYSYVAPLAVPAAVGQAAIGNDQSKSQHAATDPMHYAR